MRRSQNLFANQRENKRGHEEGSRTNKSKLNKKISMDQIEKARELFRELEGKNFEDSKEEEMKRSLVIRERLIELKC